MKNLTLTDDEYNSVMVTLREALEASFDPKHEELSVLYHTLGTTYGYEDGLAMTAGWNETGRCIPCEEGEHGTIEDGHCICCCAEFEE